MIDKEIYEIQIIQISIYIYINNTNNCTKWYSNDNVRTLISDTLDTFQCDRSVLNDDAS